MNELAVLKICQTPLVQRSRQNGKLKLTYIPRQFKF